MKAKQTLRIIPAVLTLFICFLFFTAGTGKVFAQRASEGGFNYRWDPNIKDGIEITKYVGKEKEVRIPSTIQNYKVTMIGSSAFRSDRNITSVTIPNTVTVIDGGPNMGAFSGCTSLASVTIANGVTAIGNRAFNGCAKLASVTIGNGVASIGEYAFENCTGLDSVTIGNGVTAIGRDAFSGCTSLPKVTIPRSVATIGITAFKNCTNLLSVTFQGTIAAKDLGTAAGSTSGYTINLFPGDLGNKYLARDGGPGTYIRFTNGKEWRKQ